MAAQRAYSFRDSWLIPADPQRVFDVLVDLERYAEWWPQVRAVGKLGPDDAVVVARSRLPYSLTLRLHAISRTVDLLETQVTGDLEGEVRWRLEPQSGATMAYFEQDVDVTSRLLRWGTSVVRPLLEWNHAVMMRGCVQGLIDRLESSGAR